MATPSNNGDNNDSLVPLKKTTAVPSLPRIPSTCAEKSRVKSATTSKRKVPSTYGLVLTRLTPRHLAKLAIKVMGDDDDKAASGSRFNELVEKYKQELGFASGNDDGNPTGGLKKQKRDHQSECRHRQVTKAGPAVLKEMEKRKQPPVANESRDMPDLLAIEMKRLKQAQRRKQLEIEKRIEVERQRMLKAAEKEVLQLEKKREQRQQQQQRQKGRVVQETKEMERKRTEAENEHDRRKVLLANQKSHRALDTQRISSSFEKPLPSSSNAIEREQKTKKEKEKAKDEEKQKKKKKKKKEEEIPVLKNQEAERLRRESEWFEKRKERESKQNKKWLDYVDSCSGGDVLDIFVDEDTNDLAPPDQPTNPFSMRNRKLK